MGSENIYKGNKKILGINNYVYGLFPHMDRHSGYNDGTLMIDVYGV